MATRDIWKPILPIDPEMNGAVIPVPAEFKGVKHKKEKPGERNGLILHAVDLTFGTEEVSLYSDKTQLRAPVPYVLISTADAAALGIPEGAEVEIRCAGERLRCELKTSGDMADGIAVAPRLHGFPVDVFSGKAIEIAQVQ